MVGKLIVLIATLVIFVFYVGFNLDNRCDIWLFVKTYKNVPVFMNSLISFAFGILCSLPLVFVGRINRRRRQEEKEERIERKSKKNKKPEILIEENKE